MNLIYMYNFIYRMASNHTVDSSLFKLTLIRAHRNLLWQLGLGFSSLLATLHSESDKTGKVIKCTSSYALFNLLPFRPMMKLTLAPRGTSSMV